MKYAVPPGSARITLLIALAARYTGCPASDWDDLDGLDTHPPFQISGHFGYSFGKTRNERKNVEKLEKQGLTPILHAKIDTEFPHAFAHFARLRTHPAF